MTAILKFAQTASTRIIVKNNFKTVPSYEIPTENKGRDLHHLINTINIEASLSNSNGTTTNLKPIGILSTKPQKSLGSLHKNIGTKYIEQHISQESLLISDEYIQKHFIDITNEKNYMPTDKDQQAALINLKMIRDMLLSLENTEHILNSSRNEYIPTNFLQHLKDKRATLAIANLHLENSKDPYITGTIKYIKAGEKVPENVLLGLGSQTTTNTLHNLSKYTNKIIKEQPISTELYHTYYKGLKNTKNVELELDKIDSTKPTTAPKPPDSFKSLNDVD
jgi:hypothetical protein